MLLLRWFLRVLEVLEGPRSNGTPGKLVREGKVLEPKPDPLLLNHKSFPHVLFILPTGPEDISCPDEGPAPLEVSDLLV